MTVVQRTQMSRLISFILLAALSPVAYAATGVRVLLGLTDQASTKWDGGVSARGARIVSLEPWRFEGEDAIAGNQWRMATHPIRLFGAQGPRPVVANGVIVWLDGESDSSELAVKTPQGAFTVKLGDVPFGKVSFALNRGAMADRVPAASRITSSPDEQDYPVRNITPSRINTQRSIV